MNTVMQESPTLATELSLCTYSRSEVLASSILPQCPIGLTSSQHGACPCKRRRYDAGPRRDLRVIECLFPKTYTGDVVRDPERFRQSIEARTRKSMPKTGETTMTTAVADPPKNGVAKTTKPAAASVPAANDPNPGLWCGIPIPIIGVCGEKWTGKTLFVSSIDPERTLMLDLEDSSASYSNIPFAKRESLYDVMQKKYSRVPKPIECFTWFRETVEGLKPGEYSVLAVDPITDIEQGMVDWVYEHPADFGHTKAQYDKGGGIMWGDVKQFWKMLLGIVATKVETLAFTAHMGAVWKGSAPVEGKRKAKGKDTLFELASLYLQLERPLDEKGRQPDKPSARVLKSRLAISGFVDGEIVHKPILPPYLKVATPKSIREYIRNPPDYGKLKASEIAPPEQMTSEDKLLIEAGIAENQRIAAEANLSRMEQMRRAGEEQARIKREREAQQEANAAKAEVVQPQSQAPTAGGGETVTTATGTEIPATHAALSEVQECSDRANLKALHAKVKDLFAALQATPDKMIAILGKRGVKTVEALSMEQAEELRGALQDAVNKRLAAAKAEQAPFK